MVLGLIYPTSIGHSNVEKSVVYFDGTFTYDDENETIQIDYEYADVIRNENVGQDVDMSASTSNKTREEHPSIEEKHKKKIKPSKSDRLSRTAMATETLAEQNNFLEIKKWYYGKKNIIKRNGSI